MKKITSEKPISFRVNGDTILQITPEGTLAQEAHAALAKERLGNQITVVDADVKSEAKKVLEKAEDKKPEDKKVDEKPEDKKPEEAGATAPVAPAEDKKPGETTDGADKTAGATAPVAPASPAGRSSSHGNSKK